MKRIIPLLFLTIIVFISCEKDNQEINRTESEFVTNLGLEFIFLNESNEDLIDKSNIQSYPISFGDKYSEISNDDITTYNDKIYFNGNANTLLYNSELDKNIWKTIVYGFDNINEYETYVRFANNDTDTILVNYSFSTDCYGRHYCAEITKAYYNGKLIYLKDNNIADFIYVTKSENETKIDLK